MQSFVECPENVPTEGSGNRLKIVRTSRFESLKKKNHHVAWNRLNACKRMHTSDQSHERRHCRGRRDFGLQNFYFFHFQIRFVGAENPRADRRRLMWTYHTAHLHGHDMFLLSMGQSLEFNNF